MPKARRTRVMDLVRDLFRELLHVTAPPGEADRDKYVRVALLEPDIVQTLREAGLTARDTPDTEAALKQITTTVTAGLDARRLSAHFTEGRYSTFEMAVLAALRSPDPKTIIGAHRTHIGELARKIIAPALARHGPQEKEKHLLTLRAAIYCALGRFRDNVYDTDQAMDFLTARIGWLLGTLGAPEEASDALLAFVAEVHPMLLKTPIFDEEGGT